MSAQPSVDCYICAYEANYLTKGIPVCAICVGRYRLSIDMEDVPQLQDFTEKPEDTQPYAIEQTLDQSVSFEL